MLSPVCTPIGSTFSIEQMMMQLSARSRTTSISYSFQPKTLSSISTSVAGDASRPDSTMARNSSRLYATPPPVPPIVKDGRIMVGRPTFSSPSRASSIVWAIAERGLSSPMRSIASRNSKRSSAMLMASRSAPISCTPYFSSVPSPAKAIAVLSAVCPPIVGKMASGFSFSIMRATTSGVMGST